MIVGGYSLDLYCDALVLSHGTGGVPLPPHEYGEFPHNFTAQTGAVCRRAARRAGWKLDLKTGEAWCPKCKRPRAGGAS